MHFSFAVTCCHGNSLLSALASWTVSPPAQGATTHGATPGTHQVTPSGAFTYSIPIAVPLGTAGIEPKLSLAYNSQGGNGLLGMGWSLAGLSVIHRCPKTVVQDGVHGSVNYNANDRYCLTASDLLPSTAPTRRCHRIPYRVWSHSRIVSYGSQAAARLVEFDQERQIIIRHR
jgi:hypothetical protein